MNTPQVTIKSYLPPEKRERSKLQQVKDKHRSFTQTNKEGIPKDLNELKLIKYREHAIAFLNEYMNIDKKITKSKYCKSNHISHNSLNTGLKLLGYKLAGNQTTRDQSRPTETNLDQSRPIGTKLEHTRPKQSKSKHKKTFIPKSEIKAGIYTDEKSINEDEEINDMINNSLANLQLVNGPDT